MELLFDRGTQTDRQHKTVTQAQGLPQQQSALLPSLRSLFTAPTTSQTQDQVPRSQQARGRSRLAQTQRQGPPQRLSALLPPLQFPLMAPTTSQTQNQVPRSQQTRGSQAMHAQTKRQGPPQRLSAPLQSPLMAPTTSQTQDQVPRSQQTRSSQANRAQTQRQTPRRRMNSVNMPSDTKVSIVITSRSTCSCSTVGENLKLMTLKPDGRMSGREYKIVADEMHKTLQAQNYASYNIKQIQKVQNCCLWSKFRAIEKTIVKDAGYVNERMLFHGSAAADVIVKTGFDLSKARGGLFGHGVYFAKNSSKSNQYSPGYLGHRRMLFCRVALGRMHKTTTSGGTAPLGHHSVEGMLAVPEYVIYNADQAYPEYLVYYDISN